MSTQEVSAEELAQLMHHYHEALAPDFGFTSKAAPELWEHLPQQEKNRAVVATRLALLEIASAQKDREASNRHFAKPGEAEWGC